MTISLHDIEKILKEANLFKEFIYEDKYHYALPVANQTFTDLSYDSRKVSKDTLFFCKGLNFKSSFLEDAVGRGLAVYISETTYDSSAYLGIIVTDIRQAMSLISMAFFDYPQKKMKLIGFTGTKGKTTAAYFLKAMLDEMNNGKTAMISTMNTTLDGKTFVKSELTTPESMDLFSQMNEAVENGMTHFVMEVSSQAYKLNRVYGLHFDIGIFMNISPDHISPIEHPTLEDYYYCKRQLLQNSSQFVVNLDTDNVAVLLEECLARRTPLKTYSRHSKDADYWWEANKNNSLAFNIESYQNTLNIAGDYQLQLMGDFNKDNAVASAVVAGLLGANREQISKGLSKAIVPGRMEQVTQPNGAIIYVDYAHNYLSMKSLLEFARKERPNGRILTVIGSPGGKSLSRRKDFGEVLSELTDYAFLTSDDPAFEDPFEIAKEISQHITNKEVVQIFEMDRKTAIHQAIDTAKPDDTIILAAKGRDLYQKVEDRLAPYEGDYQIAYDYVTKTDK